jgi:hypothetical protein
VSLCEVPFDRTELLATVVQAQLSTARRHAVGGIVSSTLVRVHFLTHVPRRQRMQARQAIAAFLPLTTRVEVSCCRGGHHVTRPLTRGGIAVRLTAAMMAPLLVRRADAFEQRPSPARPDGDVAVPELGRGAYSEAASPEWAQQMLDRREKLAAEEEAARTAREAAALAHRAAPAPAPLGLFGPSEYVSGCWDTLSDRVCEVGTKGCARVHERRRKP